MISIRVCCVALLTFVGCRGEMDQKIDSLTATGIVVKRDSTGAVFWIDTAGNSLDEHFWKIISSLEQLEQLSLTGSTVSDTDLSQITALQTLHGLDLSYTRITPAGLRILSRMEGLQTLSLNGIRLDESSVEQLGHFTRLKSLSLIDTDLKPEEYQRIQNDLSGCLVVW